MFSYNACFHRVKYDYGFSFSSILAFFHPRRYAFMVLPSPSPGQCCRSASGHHKWDTAAVLELRFGRGNIFTPSGVTFHRKCLLPLSPRKRCSGSSITPLASQSFFEHHRLSEGPSHQNPSATCHQKALCMPRADGTLISK